MTRARALRVAVIAAAHGVKLRYAYRIAFAARAKRLGAALAFALIEQESGFKHIFGCDAGGPFCHERVTEWRYRRLQVHVRQGGTSQGVGLAQITYGPYITQNDGLWKPRANVHFGFDLIRRSIDGTDGNLRLALAIYNGGPANPQFGYADEVLARRNKWRTVFR